MNTSQFTSLLAFILITHLTNGQENICVCGSYSTVYSDSKYESILPRNVIRKKQIKTLIIYTQASVRNKIVGPDKYKEVKFVFNSEGVITSQTLYFNGKPERIHEFERNGAGKVIKRTTSYLDILEQKEKRISPVQITDYSYDNKHRLIKIKDRGFNGNTLADSKSSLIKYEYDEKDRLKKTINQYYYEGENGPVTSIYSTNFKYLEKEYRREALTYENQKLFLTKTSVYNHDWKPLQETEHNNIMNELASKSVYEYNTSGQLLKYETKPGGGAVDECPEQGRYVDTYSYDGDGLVSRVIHSYEDKKCDLIFEYK